MREVSTRKTFCAKPAAEATGAVALCAGVVVVSNRRQGRMKNIAVAIDFSAVTGAVVEQAALLARAFRAHLWLIHVAAPEPEFVGYEPGPQTVRDQRALELRVEHRSLQALTERLRAEEIEATALLIPGPTVETILHEAEKTKADVIVLGSHGHGFLRRALLGSVSEGVLHDARRPVLIVPSSREEAGSARRDDRTQEV